MSRPDIAWHDGHVASVDALRAHVAGVLGGSPPWIEVSHHCPGCGSDRHGRPWVRLPGRWAPFVSLSRCGEHLVTAVADHPVGVDVESVRTIAAGWDPDLLLHPGESARTDRERAALWCRKEAVLKAKGVGLAAPMTGIRCADWPVEDLPAPPGLWASVVVLPQAGSGGSSTS